MEPDSLPPPWQLVHDLEAYLAQGTYKEHLLPLTTLLESQKPSALSKPNWSVSYCGFRDDQITATYLSDMW